MKATHTIKVNGIYYRTGEEIPENKRKIEPEKEMRSQEMEPERKKAGRPPKIGE